jgi:hypothetical protein
MFANLDAGGKDPLYSKAIALLLTSSARFAPHLTGPCLIWKLEMWLRVFIQSNLPHASSVDVSLFGTSTFGDAQRGFILYPAFKLHFKTHLQLHWFHLFS